MKSYSDIPLFDRHPLASDLYDDFTEYDSVGRWLFTDTPTGLGNNVAALLADGTASAVKLTNEDSANAEGILATRTAWKIAANKPLLFESRAKASSAQQAVFIGHTSGGNSQVFSTASALAGTWSGFGFYKLDLGGYWIFKSNVGATSYGANTSKFAVSYSVYQSFRVEVTPISSTVARITPMVDVLGGDNYAMAYDYTSGLPVQHELTYSSYVAAYMTFATSQGSGANTNLCIDSARTRVKR